MTSKERFGLNEKTIQSLKKIFLKYPQIEKVILYGSRAKGNYKPGSDIDLTLLGPTIDLTTLLKIENEIDDLMLAYKVDLSIHHQIDNTNLLEHIQRVGVEFT